MWRATERLESAKSRPADLESRTPTKSVSPNVRVGSGETYRTTLEAADAFRNSLVLLTHHGFVPSLTNPLSCSVAAAISPVHFLASGTQAKKTSPVPP